MRERKKKRGNHIYVCDRERRSIKKLVGKEEGGEEKKKKEKKEKKKKDTNKYSMWFEWQKKKGKVSKILVGKET